MDVDYTAVFKDEAAVKKYAEEVYAPGTYGSAINERQREWISSFASAAFDAPPALHDFACGTGRVMRMLEGRVSEAHGYDVSPQMTARATSDGVIGTFHVVSSEGELPTPAPTPAPRLVTMFRLFLNTSDDVRHRALDFAERALPEPESGYLLIENHGHHPSLRRLSRKRDRPWFNQLATSHVEQLLAGHGFELAGQRAFSVLPARAYRTEPARPLVTAADRAASRAPGAARVAVDVVYVVRRRARRR